MALLNPPFAILSPHKDANISRIFILLHLGKWQITRFFNTLLRYQLAVPVKTKNYYFLSCSIFNVFRLFYLNLIFLSGLIFFFGLTTGRKVWLTYGIISLMLHLFYLLTKFGSIGVSHTFSGTKVKISTLFRDYHLHGPLQSKTWWNYDFEDIFMADGILMDAYEGAETKSHQGHTIVWLELMDANGEIIYIFESITLSDKPTDPHPYHLRTPQIGDRVIQVQNVNGLLQFLEQTKVLETKKRSYA